MQASLQLTARRFTRQLRFGLVGVSGLIVNSSILWVLVHSLRLAIPAASVIATEVAIGSNFLLNDRWTFAASMADRSLVQRFVRFNGVALGGMVITMLMLIALTQYVYLDLVIANLVAVGTATIWNYAASSRWTWGSARSKESEGRSQPTPNDENTAPPAPDRDEELAAYWFLLSDRDEVGL